MDEFADALLTEERVCEIQLPRMTQRKVLEETEGLPARRSKLGRAMGVLDDDGLGDEDEEADRERYMSRSPSGSRSPTPEREATPEFWTEGSEEEGEEALPKRQKSLTKKKVTKSSSSSKSGSDRFISRSPSPAGSGGGRYLSRSLSPGSDSGKESGRVSVNMQVDEAEWVDGDV